MTDPLVLTLALMLGLLLSVPMVGGLWFTLRRLSQARRPWLLMLMSFWMRLAITVFGFYLITAGDWQRGVAALLGFIIGRTLLVTLLKQRPVMPTMRRT